MSGMGERWLTSLTGSPRALRVAGALLALAAFGQAIGQAVSLGFANSGKVANPETLAFSYAVALSVLALLSTLPLLLPRPTGAAVITALANVLVLAVFSVPTIAGALGAVLAAGRLGADGELRSVAGRPVGPAGAQYLAVGLALPFLVLALVRHENVACVLLAAGVPMAAGAGIALRAGRAARTYSEAGEALADTLVAHTARGERARIARELHDVVAHHISMIAVQAETGRLTVPGLPEAGARRFLEIGDTARAGLTEMRRLLGVLREDAADAAETGAGTRAPGSRGPGAGEPGSRGPGAGAPGVSRQPQPGLAQLAELIDAARDASVAGTRLIISGPVAPLDPGVELAAYRIVQEALTNARRHATGAAVDLSLRDLKSGDYCELGGRFEDINEIAATDYFERKLASGEIAGDDTRLKYRRLLHWAMSSVGFENDPFTFWHYDWGSQLYVKMTRVLRANPVKAAWYGYIAPP